MDYLSICLCYIQLLSSVSYFGEYRYFDSFSKFISRYFILFHVLVNGIDSLISVSDLSLLGYRNVSDFLCINFLSANLPNSLMSSSSFLVASLGFSMYSIMSSENSDSFTSSFPIWIVFISFYSLIAMAKCHGNCK
uniref:Uncharacterized protein n=1 Tax=Sus scrofa TaxID=9823 RepID=A0A8D0HW86_PIG